MVTTLRQHFGVCCGDNIRSTFCGSALVTTLGQLFCGVLWWQLWVNILQGVAVTTLGQHSVGVLW